MRTNTMFTVKVGEVTDTNTDETIAVNVIAVKERDRRTKELCLNYYLQLEDYADMFFIVGECYNQPNGHKTPDTREEIREDIFRLCDCGYFDLNIQEALDYYHWKEDRFYELMNKEIENA